MLKGDQSYSAGSGHNEFSCVSSQKIRDTLCEEHTGNFFPLESWTGRHRTSKIVTLSSWLPVQGAVLLLVGSFAIDLIVNRTDFLPQLFIYCSPSTALWCWQAQPVPLHQLAQVGYICTNKHGKYLRVGVKGSTIFLCLSLSSWCLNSAASGAQVFKWCLTNVKSVYVTDWPPPESTLRQEKQVAALARERKAMVFFHEPGGCVSMAASGDLTLWWGFWSWKEGLCVESEEDEALRPGSAVKLCEVSPSSQERWGHALQGSSEPLGQCCYPTGSPLPVDNLPGALQTSPVTTAPLPAGAKEQQAA